MDLRAQNSIAVHLASKVTGATTLAMEAPTVDDYGDAVLDGLYCVEGNTVTVHQASRDIGSGAIHVVGSTVDLYGDFLHSGNVTVTSTGYLVYHQASLIRYAGNVQMTAGDHVACGGGGHPGVEQERGGP